MRLNQPFTQSPDQQPCKGQATLAPIIGIIDEGIGYLNTRFCRQSDELENKQHETRILALWQQSMNATQSSRDGNGPCDIGRILSRDDITVQLNAVPYKTEFEIYQENNNSLFGQNTHRSTEQNFSHGTAVLDVAAGADPVYEDVVLAAPMWSKSLKPVGSPRSLIPDLPVRPVRPVLPILPVRPVRPVRPVIINPPIFLIKSKFGVIVRL